MKRHVFEVFFFLIILCLLGCGVNIIELVPSHSFIKSYTLKENQVFPVGSTIIRIESLYYSPAYTSIIKYQYHNIIKILPGQTWIAVASLEGVEGNIIVHIEDYARYFSRSSGVWGIHIDKEGKMGKGIASAVGQFQGVLGNPKEVAFKEIKSTATEKGSFAAELVYSGITGNTLRISYREYADDFARPTFFQDLTYNLADSNIITFRSMKLRISHADNSNIEFSVEEDGDLPWIPLIRRLIY